MRVSFRISAIALAAALVCFVGLLVLSGSWAGMWPALLLLGSLIVAVASAFLGFVSWVVSLESSAPASE